MAGQALLRIATADDAERISELVSRLTREHIVPGETAPARERLLASMSADELRRHIGEGYEYHVIEDSGEIVAAAGTRDDSHLYHLFVAEPWQGRGLSRRLWEVAKARCIARSGTRRFTVNSSVNAVRVYESFGFVRDGPECDDDGLRYQPMVLDEHHG